MNTTFIDDITLQYEENLCPPEEPVESKQHASEDSARKKLEQFMEEKRLRAELEDF